MRLRSLCVIALLSFSILGCDDNFTLCQLQPASLFAFCVETESGKESEVQVSKLKDEAWICASPEESREMKELYQECRRDLRRCQD